MTQTTASTPSPLVSFFRKRRIRELRESITAYLFLLPAFIIIGTFGLFPMAFSVYVSLHRWRIIPGKYLGLDHYARGLDALVYVAGLWLVVMLAYRVVKSLLDVRKDSQETDDRPWPWLVPAAITSAGLFLFVRFCVFLLPEVLAIAEKVKGIERTQELFLNLLGEAWRAPQVVSSRGVAFIVLIVGFGLAYAFDRWVSPGPRSASYYTRLMIVFLMLGGGVALGWLTLSEIQEAYAVAAEEGEAIRLWSQISTMSAGIVGLIAMSVIAKRMEFPGPTKTLLIVGGGVLVLGAKLLVDSGNASTIEILLIAAGGVIFFFSWRAWQQARNAPTTAGLIAWIFASLVMMLAAWLLMTEVPTAIKAGYDDWWEGLLHTVYYVLFTVPIELVLGLFLAILLFQEIKGKGFFRLIYFLPYVTNPVAAASVFRVIFSSRVNGLMNSLVTFVGIDRLLWLDEPKGIIQMLLPALDIPPMLAGPSLALFVICLYGIWTYAGYNTVVFLAGLGGIPRPLYEAASIDGAGRWGQFRHVTLPLLSPTTYFLSLMAVIGTFKAFNHIFVLRSGAALGTTDTASIIIFNEFNRNTRYGYASALALVMMGIILVVTYINNRVAEEKVFYG